MTFILTLIGTILLKSIWPVFWHFKNSMRKPLFNNLEYSEISGSCESGKYMPIHLKPKGQREFAKYV